MCDHLRDIITTKRVAKLVYNEKPAIDDNMPFNNKNCVAIYVLIIGLLITLAVILYYENVTWAKTRWSQHIARNVSADCFYKFQSCGISTKKTTI
jgi:hypothetical protein